MVSKRILAIVVAYCYEEKVMLENISRFEPFVDKVIIWDNTPNDNKKVLSSSKIERFGNGYNKGISYALNFAWRYAKQNNYDYILTMDQDTVWHDFNRFKQTTVDNSNAPFGIWGPQNSESQQNNILFEKTLFLITSGMLISIGIVDRLGGWPNRYFVDGIDNEICCRAIQMDIPIYSVNAGWIEQTCGVPLTKTIGKHSFIVHNYPPSRLFEIYKNHIITFRKYPKAKHLKRIWMNEWFKWRIFYVLLENNSLKKIYAIIRGIIEGLKSNYR